MQVDDKKTSKTRLKVRGILLAFCIILKADLMGTWSPLTINELLIVRFQFIRNYCFS